MGDIRDKFKQGVEEAKKAFSARSDNVVEIFDAGSDGKIFYCVMQYFDGITCQEWIDLYRPPLLVRAHLCKMLLKLNQELLDREIAHGDLHLNNILVHPNKEACADGRLHNPKFLVIDFGASLFTRRDASRDRHWRVLFQTLDKLLATIKLKDIFRHKYPDGAEKWAITRRGGTMALAATILGRR